MGSKIECLSGSHSLSRCGLRSTSDNVRSRLRLFAAHRNEMTDKASDLEGPYADLNIRAYTERLVT